MIHDTLLNEFDLISLRGRRLISASLFLYKLLNNLIDCPYLLSKIPFYTPRIAARNHNYFYLPNVRINVGYFSPIIKMCYYYNKFHIYVDLFGISPNSYKIRLVDIWKTRLSNCI